MRNRACLPVLLLPIAPWVLAGTALATPTFAGKSAVRAARLRIPLAFEENSGQADPAVRFVARMPGRRVFLTDDAAWTSDEVSPDPATDPEPFRISLEGADPAAAVVGEGRLARATNYFIGDDPRLWQRNVPTFSRVRYRSVYPGIDLVYYGSPDRLEFDFEVSPGADPGRIRLSIASAEALALEPGGDICASAGLEDRRLLPPTVYQDVDGRRRPVSAGYVVSGGQNPSVGFRIGDYDRRAPLVIDPVLLYSTYLGGTDLDEVDAIAVDSEGNAYMAGRAYSSNFPVSANAPQHAFGGNEDTYVTKINAAGTAIVYSTYLGGSDRDFGNAIAVDALGQAVVAGRTISPNFPGAANSPIQNAKRGEDDGFVAKLDATGSTILFSTYLGGSATDKVEAVAIDPNGNILVAGQTDSGNFPGTAGNPFGSAYRGNFDAFVAKLDSGGFSILYAAYLGGSETDSASAIAADRDGNAYVAGATESPNLTGAATSPIQKVLKGGSDAYVVKVDPAGSKVVYSTYLGGSAEDFADGVAVDAHGNAVVAGYTTSPNFPGTSGGFQPTNHGQTDAFVTEINPAGSAIVSSTYLGGSGDDYTDGVALDALGDVYIAGYTESLDFPGAAASAIQPAYAGNGDGFVAELTPGGRGLVYSTYLGGSARDEAYAIAVRSRSACVGGITDSVNFKGAGTSPIQNHFAGGESDGFVALISAVDVPPRSSAATVDLPAPAIVTDR
jgi:hypothetical protein